MSGGTWFDLMRFDAGLALPSPEGRAALLASSALHFDCPPPAEPTLEDLMISRAHAIRYGGRSCGKTETMRQAMDERFAKDMLLSGHGFLLGRGWP